MSATCVEKDNGRRARVSTTGAETVEVEFLVQGATNLAAARNLAYTSVPLTEPGVLGTLHRQEISAQELSSKSGSGSLYAVAVNYSLVDYSTGQTQFQFDTGGGSETIKFSKATVGSYPVGAAPSWNNGINVTATDVGGVEINIARFGFTAVKFASGTQVTGAYVSDLVEATGKTNNNTWSPTIDGISFSFQEGEVLFMGASGSRRGGGDFEISMAFAVSPNATNLTVGGIMGIAKKGWELLWVIPQGAEGGSGSNAAAGQLPRFVYVEKVYDEGSFAVFGL